MSSETHSPPRGTISPRDLFALHQAGRAVDLIDVRTPSEFREVHASMARVEPLDALDPNKIAQARAGRGGEPIYLICRGGARAQKAQEAFRQAGFENVVCVEGGTQAWEQAGLPVERGKKTIALERQVRIAAGTLVVIGTLLGAFVHPWLLGIAGFVGAGLIFAGITDTCGMAMLLAKMPWNR